MVNRCDETGDFEAKEVEGTMIGYARVSTKQQSLQMQIDFLLEAGVAESNIYMEKLSARSDNRPELKKAIRQARSGDMFVVYKLDRLSRDLPELIGRLDHFAQQGIIFKSITEGIAINLSNCRPAERLQVNMIASLAQFEVDQSKERTTDGIKRARERGVVFGAKNKISDAQVREAMLLRDKGMSISEVAKKYKVVPNTIIRRINKYVKENP